jgi:hypothetical protein
MTSQKYFPCWRASTIFLPVMASLNAVAEVPTFPKMI